MTRVSAASIFVVCLTTILFVNSITSANVQQPEIETMAWNDFVGYLCQQGYYVRPADICNAYTTTTTTTSTTTTTTTTGKHTTGTTRATTTVEPSTTSTEELTGSALERAHWCQFKNGSYLSLGQTFIYNKCSLCQCVKSRAIRCSNFQCMAAYCLDGSRPYVQDGQCCQQCGYENVSTACVVNGIKFPHGTLLRRTTDNIQCWCQLGSVECRKSSVVSSNSLDLWGNGSAIYVVVVIVIAIVLIGVLLCCAGGIFFYYFYNKNEQTFQEAHDQYYSNAGWQPMSEDGQVVVDEKQVEAGAQQYAEFPTERLSERIPPPYAMYNGTVEQQ